MINTLSEVSLLHILASIEDARALILRRLDALNMLEQRQEASTIITLYRNDLILAENSLTQLHSLLSQKP